MSAINKIFALFDLSKLVPDMETFLGKLRSLTALAAMIGPIVMLIIGLLYLFRPTPEANRRIGFRTYFGMGSVQAWRFSQRIAGLVWTTLGGLLTVATGIVCLIGGKDPLKAVQASVVMLIIQAILALLCWIALVVIISVTFDKDGKRRS